MPVTPFHFGPGALLHSAAPRRVSFLAFCVANVLTDVEPLVFMLRGESPLHRFCHTFVGATVVAAGTVALFLAARAAAPRLRLPNVLGWRDLAVAPVVVGAVLGTSSHVVLDALMHGDVRPFAPFSDANPLLRVVSLRALHLGCVAAGALGLAVLAARRARRAL